MQYIINGKEDVLFKKALKEALKEHSPFLYELGENIKKNGLQGYERDLRRWININGLEVSCINDLHG